MTRPRTWGILCPLPDEYATLGLRPPNPGIVKKLPTGEIAIVSGMGADSATLSAQKLIHSGAEGLIVWGTAAGLRPEVKQGTCYVAERIAHHVCSYPLENLSLPKAIFTHSVALLQTPSAKQTLAEKTGAHIADMESLSIATVASQHQIPWLAIRAVADDAQTSLPTYLSQTRTEENLIHTRHLLLLALTHPAQWGRFYRMACGGLSALRALKAQWTILRDELNK